MTWFTVALPVQKGNEQYCSSVMLAELGCVTAFLDNNVGTRAMCSF